MTPHPAAASLARKLAAQRARWPARSPSLAPPLAVLKLAVAAATMFGEALSQIPSIVSGPAPAPSSIGGVTGMSPADQGFVTVSGQQFMLNCKRFVFAGSNSWDLMENATDPAKIWTVNATLDEMVASGLTVLRTWPFAINPKNALQPRAGIYSEATFEALDYVLYQCQTRGLRVILPFVNYWYDPDGVGSYVLWSSTAQTKDDFFADENCRDLYRDHVQRIISRVNTFSGVRYGDDPTILAWNLLNEPRCMNSSTCTSMVQDWVASMSAFVKSVDSKHLLTTGFEGFYSWSSNRTTYNPNNLESSWASNTGQDFILNHRLPSIDFAVAHLWTDNWWPSGTPWSEELDFLKNWIDIHNSDAQTLLSKPIVWEEFGKSISGNEDLNIKNAFFIDVYIRLWTSMSEGGPVQGSNFYVFNSPGRLSPSLSGAAFQSPVSHGVVALLSRHGSKSRRLIFKAYGIAGSQYKYSVTSADTTMKIIRSHAFLVEGLQASFGGQCS
eukprot:SM000098S25090  [mRNA]  locus=s98:134035:137644:- [translate_table: standard]